ncbi:MAG: glycerol-3-phosphate 1-O-acyltransferase PlsY [Desulfurivibrionaceae bacterium]
MEYIAIIVIAYLIGSLPFGLLVGKLAGIDVRRAGSGNIGATNVSRLLGRKLGLITLLLDIGKGYLPMLAVSTWGAPVEITMFTGLAAFLGHLYPVYLGFRGGKGVATALGVFIFLDWIAIIISLVLFAVVTGATGFVSAGSLTASLAMVILLLAFHGMDSYFWLGAVVALLIWWRHRGNIRRLVRGGEKSWKDKGK